MIILINNSNEFLRLYINRSEIIFCTFILVCVPWLNLISAYCILNDATSEWHPCTMMVKPLDSTFWTEEPVLRRCRDMKVLSSFTGPLWGESLVTTSVKGAHRASLKKIEIWTFLKLVPHLYGSKTGSSLCLITHWGGVMHICVSKLTIIGSDNGLSPDRLQAIIWTNAGILLIGPLGTNFSEILIEILTFSFKKMHLKVSSAKRRPFCLGLNVITDQQQEQCRP